MVLRRLVLLPGLGLLHLLQFDQRLLQSLQALTGRPLTGRPLLRRELWVGGRSLDRIEMLASRLQMLLQGLFFLEAIHAGAGADTGAVLGDPLDRNDPGLNEDREHLGQEAVHRLSMIDPEIVDGVVVKADPTAQRTIELVVGTDVGQPATPTRTLRG